MVETDDIHDTTPPRLDTYDKEGDLVFVSKIHNEAERKENLRLALFLSDHTGECVYLLPHIQPTQKDAGRLRSEYFPQGVKEDKNPDFYFSGRFVDGKNLTTIAMKPDNTKAVKRKIQNRLAEAFEQADDAFVEVNTSIPMKLVRDAIKGKLTSSKHRHVVYVKYREELFVFGAK